MERRWVPVLLLGALAAVLAGAIISISVGEKGSQTIEITGAGEVQQLIGGIRQLDERLGDEDAPIRLTLFIDVMSPRAAAYQAEVVDPLIEQRVRTGEASINLKHYPEGLKPTTAGAVGVEAAAAQDHGWQYAALFMRNLGEVPEEGVNQEFLNEVAAVVPKLEVTAWEELVVDSASNAAAEEDNAQATALRLPAGQTVIVETDQGTEELLEAPSLAEIEAAIERLGGVIA